MWALQGGIIRRSWRTHDWDFYVSSIGTTRPNNNQGTSVTPAQNSMGGAWAQVLTALEQDVYLVAININSGSTSAAARDMLIDIGVDPAGGTSYTVWAQELLCSAASALNVGQGVWYVFKCKIPAGATVAARASVNNATVGTVRVWIQAWGAPKNLRDLRYGTFIRTFGTAVASSSGTALTSGTTSDGTWVSLGTTADRLWQWQGGVGVNNATISGGLYHYDFAISPDAGTTKIIVLQDVHNLINSNESMLSSGKLIGTEYDVPSGYELFVRAQCSTTVDTGLSGAMYAVGG